MKKQVFLLGLVLHGGLFAVQAQQDSAKLYQKAEQLFITMKMPDIYGKGIDESVNQQVAATPALANYREDLKSFLDTCIGWPVVKTDVAKLYLKYYTPEEMDVLIKFYQTPAGKKVATVSATLVKEIQAMEQSKLQPHIGRLNQLISEKMNGKSPGDAVPGNN
jgi:hypothetical protein